MKQKFIAIILGISLFIPCIAGKVTVTAETATEIDNKNTDISYTGTWTSSSSGSGFYGDDYTQSVDGEASIPISVTVDGYYKLYARWPKGQEAAKEANINIVDGKGDEYNVLRDQTINGGYWVLVGTYFFTAQGKQRVTINAQNGETIIFDALKLILSAQTSQKAKKSWFAGSINDVNSSAAQTVEEQKTYITNLFSMRDRYKNLLKLTTINTNSEVEIPVKKEAATLSKPGDEVIYDINSKGFATSGGNWKTETDKNAYDGTYMVDGDISANFKQFAKWKPTIIKDGIYEIYMRWPSGENRPTSAKFRIKNANFVIGSAIIDQSKNSNQWNLIGTYNLYASDAHAVSIWANSSGITAADAIKVRFVSDDVPPKENSTISYERKNYTSETRDRYNIVLDDNNKFYFTKNGEVWNINGVCYSNTALYMEEGMKFFTEAGGNIVRTYATSVLNEGFLDYAYEHGIGVMAGISIPKESSYFENEETYRSYVNAQKKVIDEFKNHPALVMWSVNNESEAADNDGEIYAMIEEISAYIKEVDSYHPISTAFAGCNSERQKKLKTLAPTVEILGMNAYSIMPSAYSTSVESGWEAPIMITEYGPNGTWGNECRRTSWNAVIEQNNDEKANLYRERHLNYIMNNDKGIGGFAFCLPYAVGSEGTLSWYAFVFGGMKTPIMDEMQYAWISKYPSNMAPRIKSFTINNKTSEDDITVNPGEELEIKMYATDKENDELTYKFDIYEEVQSDLTGKLPILTASADNPKNSNNIKTTAPNVPGYYRVYAYVTDGKGSVDVNSIPIYVKETSLVKTDTAEVEKLLRNAAANFGESVGISAEVTVHADDNINGMPFTGDGTAEFKATGELIYIASDVTYQSGGNMKSEVYLGKDESWILGADKNPADSDGWYDISQVFNEIVNNKSMVDSFSLDKLSDSDYNILYAEIFMPQFYPYALSGMSSVRFMSESDKPDAYSLMIYVSKTTGNIEKVIATAGYMRSEENAEYRKLKYTYDYNCEESVELSAPVKWRT